MGLKQFLVTISSIIVVVLLRYLRPKSSWQKVRESLNDEQIGDSSDSFFARFPTKNDKDKRQFFVFLGVGVA